MLSNVGKTGMPTAAAAAAATVDSPITGGASTAGGLLSNDKDSKEAQTDAQFGNVWKNIQGKYGAKAEKAREIKKTLGKDDFLRIMVTQMRNQDPTSPFKAEQMATQIAQFTNVEQLQNLNQGMTKLQTANQPLERLAMTNMIGKTVTVDRERFPHQEGQTEVLNFALPKEASQASIAIVSETGEQIYSKEIGAMKKGENVFGWDGLKANTLPAKGGNYIFRITARDKDNQPMEVGATTTARVIGVSFEGADPVFLVGNPKSPDKILLRNVVRIDEMSQGGNLIPGAQSLAATAAQQLPGAQAPVTPQKSANFFSFNKGEGSQNIDTSALPAETREALARYETESVTAKAAAAAAIAQAEAEAERESAQAPAAPPADLHPLNPGELEQAPGSRAASAAGQKPADIEKGFPNGLNE